MSNRRIRDPLLESFDEDPSSGASRGHPCRVYFTTCIIVCGSYEFGSWVGYSSPTQAAITRDLNLLTSQYALFVSLLSIGAMIGAITSGPIADAVGRKWAGECSVLPGAKYMYEKLL